MEAAEILHTLSDQGFTLAVEGDRLTVSPSSRLTDPMRAEIRAHKPELVALLTQAANDAHTEPESPIERLERLNGEMRRALDHAHIAANAEAIGDDLERRLIEGSEALAKIRPATDPIPLATATRAEVEAWMDATGETDTVTRNEILTSYGFDPGFRYPRQRTPRLSPVREPRSRWRLPRRTSRADPERLTALHLAGWYRRASPLHRLPAQPER